MEELKVIDYIRETKDI